MYLAQCICHVHERIRVACAAAREGGCGDDGAWHKKNSPSKTCDWVSRDPYRCTVKGEDETWAFQACPDACEIC